MKIKIGCNLQFLLKNYGCKIHPKINSAEVMMTDKTDEINAEKSKELKISVGLCATHFRDVLNYSFSRLMLLSANSILTQKCVARSSAKQVNYYKILKNLENIIL
jgi:hypothetical protein